MNNTIEFYNNFMKGEQVNKRHTQIAQWLIIFGLKPGMKVLEIGCGPGTVSSLVAQYLETGTGGFLTAVDISPERIKQAKQKFAHLKKVEFIAADILDADIKGSFDMIFLPDVLEHIPYSLHVLLMQKIYAMLKDNGIVVIHIPDPLNIESIRMKKPEILQPIDQALFLDHIAYISSQTGFYVTHLQSYTVWSKLVEYQIICMKKKQYLQEQLSLGGL